MRQTRALNTHARYLYEPLIELAERLIASMPAAAGLDTVMLVNSGSEANDLAWRIATGDDRPPRRDRHRARLPRRDRGDRRPVAGGMAGCVPSGARGPHRATRVRRRHSSRAGARGRRARRARGDLHRRSLHQRRRLDTVGRGSRGGRATRRTRQAGCTSPTRCRPGTGAWASTSGRSRGHGITPDIVTLGKPMGNGYPVAAVITRREIVDRFPFARTVFSTFGGNPVAAQAALAVLDVIEDERIVERVKRVGARLLAALSELGRPEIVEVRGRGLIIGVELTDAETAERVVDRLRRGRRPDRPHREARERAQDPAAARLRRRARRHPRARARSRAPLGRTGNSAAWFLATLEPSPS